MAGCRCKGTRRRTASGNRAAGARAKGHGGAHTAGFEHAALPACPLHAQSALCPRGRAGHQSGRVHYPHKGV